jgi:hypothetical protein
VRHRLGLVPYDLLQSEQCRVCSARTAFSEDPDHFHACVKHRRTLVTARHSDLMAAVMSLARSVGFYASREPNDHARPDELEFRRASASIEEYNSHADILLLKHHLKLYVDVSVVRSTAPSKLVGKGRTDVPLAAASYRARDKHRKYDRICEVNGYTNMPFVLESNGALSHEARKLLRVLSTHSHDVTPREWLTHAQNVISVVLQSANARIAQGGMHAQTICETMWQRENHSQQRWKVSRGLALVSSPTAVQASPTQSAHPRRRMSAVAAAATAAAADSTDCSDVDDTSDGGDADECVSSGSDCERSISNTPAASALIAAHSDYQLQHHVSEQPLTQPESSVSDECASPLQPLCTPVQRRRSQQQRRQLLVAVMPADPTSASPVIRSLRVRITSPQEQ